MSESQQFLQGLASRSTVYGTPALLYGSVLVTYNRSLIDNFLNTLCVPQLNDLLQLEKLSLQKAETLAAALQRDSSTRPSSAAAAASPGWGIQKFLEKCRLVVVVVVTVTFSTSLPKATQHLRQF